MAEINSSNQQEGSKKRASKKVSTKVDMTPMVDLAFLLITFFMLTTTFNTPKIMQVIMPNKESSQGGDDDCTLVLLGGKNDKLYWYQSANVSKASLQTLDASPEKIREFLIQKKKETLVKEDCYKQFTVVVKFKDDASFKNVVDILDEMNIVGVSRYGIQDITKEEIQLIEAHNLQASK
ncbi:hypothetical protein AD998_03705 [bacterium 336/3]|jgi:biopolymer transport protein ExbD|nr:hypothetical protein AD998_03705 [bacterium 336/3]